MSGQNNNASTSGQVTLSDLRAKLAAVEAGINRYYAKLEKIPYECQPDLIIWHYVRSMTQNLKSKLSTFTVEEHDGYAQVAAVLDTIFPDLKRLEDNWKMHAPPEMQD